MINLTTLNKAKKLDKGTAYEYDNLNDTESYKKEKGIYDESKLSQFWVIIFWYHLCTILKETTIPKLYKREHQGKKSR